MTSAFRRGACALLLALPALSAPLAAQVGHAPQSSPYRDVRVGSMLWLQAGHFGGDGGTYGLAPQNGRMYGVRWDLLADRPLTIGFSGGYLDAERKTYALNGLNERVTTIVKQGVATATIDLQFNLTGSKLWHGIAPFAGAGLGVAAAINNRSNGYDFGTKFMFVPQVGTRVFLARRLALRLDARGTMWQIKDSKLSTHVPNAGLTTRGEWDMSWSLSAGLGYNVRLPF